MSDGLSLLPKGQIAELARAILDSAMAYERCDTGHPLRVACALTLLQAADAYGKAVREWNARHP